MIAARCVDQAVNRARPGANRRLGSFERFTAQHVRLDEERASRRARAVEALRQRLARLGGTVEDRDGRARADERLGHHAPQRARAAGQGNHAVAEVVANVVVVIGHE